jgi:PilZ domain
VHGIVDEERRRATRYRFMVPVHFHNGSQGRTRDMSTCGIFLETEEAHSLGDTICLSLTLDGSIVQCEARVVRVEQLEDKFGVAVELITFDFL